MHRVAVVAFDGVIAFDLAIPTEVFGRVRTADGRPGYEVRVCGVSPEVDAGAYRLRLRYGLAELRRADTVLVPGIDDLARTPAPALIQALRRAASRGARIGSICSGALVLAATGLLDGRRATTHWLAAAELVRRHPAVRVDANVLYVDEGQFLSSAGAAAGLDLCLYLVRKDYGAAVAANAARLAVMPLEREGGQAQFIVHPPPPAEGVAFAALLQWMEQRLHRPLTLDIIAKRASMSVRSLSRHFRQQTGISPLQWLLRARIRQAQSLLESTSYSVELVATHVGFGSAAAFRQQFHRATGTKPRAFRTAFQGVSRAG